MKLEHANITVKSIDDAKQFLGTAFPEFQERGGGHLHGNAELGRWLHFGTSDTYLALQENRHPSGRQDTSYENEGVNHLGFVVDDLSALVARMEKAGFPIAEPGIYDESAYRRRAYFYDQGGMEWEFVEYLSDKSEERNQY